jgi:large subunit ribosomal protein L18
MNRLVSKRHNASRRSHRTRATSAGTPDKPRLSVNVSGRHVFAQLIDDQNSISLAGFSSEGKKNGGTMSEKAEYVGGEIAKLAKSKKIKKVTFDRGDKLYHGRIKTLADAARKNGLEF